MLQNVIDLVHGIPCVRPDATWNLSAFVVRPKARKLIAARNTVYAAAFTDKAQAVAAHVAMEAYTIQVCEAVFSQRAEAYMTDHQAPAPIKARKPRRSTRSTHSSECADICVCAK